MSKSCSKNDGDLTEPRRRHMVVVCPIASVIEMEFRQSHGLSNSRVMNTNINNRLVEIGIVPSSNLVCAVTGEPFHNSFSWHQELFSTGPRVRGPIIPPQTSLKVSANTNALSRKRFYRDICELNFATRVSFEKKSKLQCENDAIYRSSDGVGTRQEPCRQPHA